MSVDKAVRGGAETTIGFDYDAVRGDYQYRALHHGPRMQRFWHRGKLTMIDRLIRPHTAEDARLLEIGCGAGNLLVRAATRGSFPVALDVAMPALRFVRERLRQASAGPEPPAGFACVQAPGDRLPFAPASFDCVLLSEVIEHLAEPHLTLREVWRVLRPGGRALVTTPNYRSFWPVMEWSIDRLKMAPAMAGEQHITRFDAASLRELLIASNLAVEYLGTMYGLSPFVALASSRWAERCLRGELERRSLRGMILVSVVSKP